jgi:hypothetical protein
VAALRTAERDRKNKLAGEQHNDANNEKRPPARWE